MALCRDPSRQSLGASPQVPLPGLLENGVGAGRGVMEEEDAGTGPRNGQLTLAGLHCCNACQSRMNKLLPSTCWVPGMIRNTFHLLLPRILSDSCESASQQTLRGSKGAVVQPATTGQGCREPTVGRASMSAPRLVMTHAVTHTNELGWRRGRAVFHTAEELRELQNGVQGIRIVRLCCRPRDNTRLVNGTGLASWGAENHT